MRNGIPKENNLNIMALIDQSGSVGQTNFELLKLCVSKFASSFNFSEDFNGSETIFGVEVFSS